MHHPARGALGVDTAINTLIDAIGRFNDTADSHHRIMVLETMGRDCGELARMAALASGQASASDEATAAEEPRLGLSNS